MSVTAPTIEIFLENQNVYKKAVNSGILAQSSQTE